MKAFYAASKVKHAPLWRSLRSKGYAITSTWIDEAGDGKTANYTELSERCIQEIKNSDFLLLYCKPGQLLKGALIEAGIALALGKEVRCIGNCHTISKVFKQHPLWKRFPNILSAIQDARENDNLGAQTSRLPNSPTWPYVKQFAFRMEKKLAMNRHKGDREGWLKEHPWNLVERILDETIEIQGCFANTTEGGVVLVKSRSELADECADVANFCMMLADNIRNRNKS